MYKCIAQLLHQVVSLYVTAELCFEMGSEESLKEGDCCEECRRLLLLPSDFTAEMNNQKKKLTVDDGSEHHCRDERSGVLEKLRHIEFVYVCRTWNQLRRQHPELRANAIRQFLRFALNHDDITTTTTTQNLMKESPQVRLIYCEQNTFFIDPDEYSAQLHQLQAQLQDRIDIPLLQYPRHLDPNGHTQLANAFPNAGIVYRLRWFSLFNEVVKTSFEQKRPAAPDDNNIANANEQQQQPLQPKVALNVIDNVVGALVNEALTIVHHEQESVHQVVTNIDDDDDDGGVAKRLPRQNLLHFQLSPHYYDTVNDELRFERSLNLTLEALLSLKSFRALVALVARTGSKCTKFRLAITDDCQWRHVRQLFEFYISGCEGNGGRATGREAVELLFSQNVYQEQHNQDKSWWSEQGEKVSGTCPKNIRPELRANFGQYKKSCTSTIKADENEDDNNDNWLKNLGLASNADFRPLITMFDWSRRKLENELFSIPNAENLADAYCSETVVARRCKSKLLSYTYW